MSSTKFPSKSVFYIPFAISKKITEMTSLKNILQIHCIERYLPISTRKKKHTKKKMVVIA